MSGHVPNLLASFAGSSRQSKTDADIIAHILSGEAFHIIAGPHAGKYVYRDDGISKYTYVGRGRRRTELERANLETHDLLVSLIAQHVSAESNALEGDVAAAPNRLAFIKEIIDQNGFHIDSGFSRGSYMYEVSKDGDLVLNHITPELCSGQIAGLNKTKARLPAVDFLDAVANGSFKFGQEQSIVFDLAMRKSFGDMVGAATRMTAAPLRRAPGE